MISQKRVQKYELFSKPPNISRRIFQFCFKFNSIKHFSAFYVKLLLIIYIRALADMCGHTHTCAINNIVLKNKGRREKIERREKRKRGGKEKRRKGGREKKERIKKERRKEK